MSKDVRSLFKPTSVSTLKKQSVRVQQAMYGARVGYLKLKSGDNKIRIYPSHPDTKTNNFIFEKVVHWLPTFKEQEDGTSKLTKKTIFNSRIHGGTEKDIVDEYIKFNVNKVKAEVQDQEEQAKLLSKLTHWKTGIQAKTGWVCYANKAVAGESEFGILELSNGVREALNDLSITEDSDEAIVVDPFTDPTTGKSIMIKYNPEAKKNSDYYKVTLLWQKDSPLGEDELEEFLKVDTLESKFHMVYNLRHFKSAVEGLQIIDKDFGAFEDPEFIDIVEEIRAYYPDEDESDDDDVPTNKIPDTKTTKEEVFEGGEDEEEEEEAPKPPAKTGAGRSRIGDLKSKK